nr:hypothetical protein [Candidatus Sigynarchaeota archaeon]
KDIRAKDYSEFATPEPFEFHQTNKGLEIKSVARPPQVISPRMVEQQPVASKAQVESTFIPDDIKWDAGGAKSTSQGNHDYWGKNDDSLAHDADDQQATTGNARLDAMLQEQVEAIMMEYSVDRVKTGQASVYIPISIENSFVILVNFLDYPAKPHFQVDAIIKELIGDPDIALDTLRNWNAGSSMVVDAIRELEGKLWALHDIEAKLKAIFGEFETNYLPESRTTVRVTILTYGFQEYHVTIDLKGYPAKPAVQYSQNLASLIRASPDTLKVIQNWDNSDKEPVAIVREINWLIDKESRMSFEIDLLRSNLKDVQYDPISKTVVATLKGTMKTEEESFQFKINLPENYPMVAPGVKLMSELDDEDMQKKMQTGLQSILGKWFPSSSYLIDVFNAISKAIFEVSVISCILCHKLDCPTCGSKMDTLDAMEASCKVVCPYCERTYHAHCWDQTIATFGKCGFCLRPPPPELMPK